MKATIQRSKTSNEIARSPEKTATVAIDACTMHATLSDGDGRAEPERIDPRTVALAAAVEALSEGHARVLAAELRARLEAASGAGGAVVALTSRRAKG